MALQNKSKLIGATCMLVILAATTSGCSSSSSKNYVTVQESTAITKGKELTDLQRALTEQAINKEEYEQLRSVIMRRPN